MLEGLLEGFNAAPTPSDCKGRQVYVSHFSRRGAINMLHVYMA